MMARTGYGSISLVATYSTKTLSLDLRIGSNMTAMIPFYLTVNYKSLSKEWLFLEKGWGIRDVRGPYLNTFMGYICISNEILLPEIPSTIALTFSLSNRCPITSILVQASALDRKVVHSINKNASYEFVFNSVFRDPAKEFRIAVSMPSIRNATELRSYSDILAIDEVTIERSQ